MGHHVVIVAYLFRVYLIGLAELVIVQAFRSGQYRYFVLVQLFDAFFVFNELSVFEVKVKQHQI